MMDLQKTIDKLKKENPCHSFEIDNKKRYCIMFFRGKPDKDGVVMGNSICFVIDKKEETIERMATLDYFLNMDKYDE
ncbi:MAG: hypothetical protein MJ133_10355 [Lachnospiraceae bacterium]|nr:hypothetical protein [Lachnospiraceae bacterium]